MKVNQQNSSSFLRCYNDCWI